LPDIILPLDGGGLRWGWTWYVSPSPLRAIGSSEPEAHPLPPGEREIIRIIF